MRRAFVYRLYPNANQVREMEIALETHRRLYNKALEQRQTAWRERQESTGYYAQTAWYTQERVTNPYFARINASSAHATLRRLDRAFGAFFRRLKAGEKPGYPRFKARDRFHSITFPSNGDGIRLTGNRLRVQHVGIIRVKLHRPTEGQIKTLCIKREAGKWYLVVSCDLGAIDVPPHQGPAIGVDLGIEAFATMSDGERIENPAYLKKALPELRRVGRAVSRKYKGGSNRKKAVRRLQVIHQRVRNQRREHHYQVANRLIRRYGTIAVESLTVRNMVRNRRLARAISDAGWSTFVNILKHQAEKAGAQIIEINPAGTSQECSGCKTTVKKSLSVRRHRCPSCGLDLHRDENAARNILLRGLARMGPAGRNVVAVRASVPREAVCFS